MRPVADGHERLLECAGDPVLHQYLKSVSCKEENVVSRRKKDIGWKNTKDSRTVPSEGLQDRQQRQDELAVVVVLLEQRVEYLYGVQRLHLRCELLVRLGHLEYS